MYKLDEYYKSDCINYMVKISVQVEGIRPARHLGVSGCWTMSVASKQANICANWLDIDGDMHKIILNMSINSLVGI